MAGKFQTNQLIRVRVNYSPCCVIATVALMVRVGRASGVVAGLLLARRRFAREDITRLDQLKECKIELLGNKIGKVVVGVK